MLSESEVHLRSAKSFAEMMGFDSPREMFEDGFDAHVSVLNPNNPDVLLDTTELRALFDDLCKRVDVQSSFSFMHFFIELARGMTKQQMQDLCNEINIGAHLLPAEYDDVNGSKVLQWENQDNTVDAYESSPATLARIKNIMWNVAQGAESVGA